MSKETKKADGVRALREAKYAARRTRASVESVAATMAEAVERSKASAEKAAAKKAARRDRDAGN